MLISFLVFFALFSGIGVASYFWRKSTIDDYFLASRDTPSWLVGLSYGATISSGATFIGFAGLAYSSPVIAFVSVGALTIGDYVAWRIAGDKIRKRSIRRKVHTYPSLVGKLGLQDMPAVTVIASLLAVVFMGVYCAAQLVAGAKIGVALFDWDYHMFVITGAVVLLAYCWAGGIRASIWTDAIQAIIIAFSLLILLVVGLEKLGGIGSVMTQLNAADPNLLNLWQYELIPIAIGWFAFGVGVLGQPQLMVRHMVARSRDDIKVARRIYFTWRCVVLGMSCMTGMVARLLIPAGESFDPELSIPALWEDLLPPVLVGLLIAGLFSATMSTADSLLLAASSALTQHILPKFRGSYGMARLGTVIVICLVVGIALMASKGVLSLVILAWGGLAAAVAPMVVVQLMGAQLSQRLAITMMLSGFLVTLVWRYGLGWHTWLMDLVPGMMTGFAIFCGAVLLRSKSINYGSFCSKVTAQMQGKQGFAMRWHRKFLLNDADE